VASIIVGSSFALLMSGCSAGIRDAAAEIAVRDTLVRGQVPPPGLGAYGYFLLTARPSSRTLPRLLVACEAHQRSLELAEEFPLADRSDLMVTFWLLRLEPQAIDDCRALVESYDYARAARLLQALGKVDVRGPVLAAWRRPPESRNSLDEALCLDMSDFQTEDDIERAFLIWKNQIARNPTLWNDGFDIVRVREALRLFLNTYGEQIVAIIRG
jgi:hypothetical protein